MKRKSSGLLSLAIMGVLPLALSGCDNTTITTTFANQDSCVTKGFTQASCHQAMESAVASDKSHPLLYADREACGKDWDIAMCTPVSATDKHYRPVLAGAQGTWSIKDKNNLSAAQWETSIPLYKLAGSQGFADASHAYFLNNYGSNEPGVTPKTFTNIQDCVSAGNSQSMCADAMAKAQADTANQPHFASENNCENQYEHCHQSSTGIWLPLMMGYMMGRSNGSSYYHPIYTARSGDYVTSSHVGYGYRPSPISTRSYSSSHAITASRHVFGSSSAARGSWGHSSFGG